jgi:hypothetical protein
VVHAGNFSSVIGYTPAYGTAAYQSKSLDTISTPGLYQYDGGFGGTKPPDNSPNYRTIEIGNGNRFSQIAMPWNSDGFYFRRQEGATFSAWRTVLHDGNYNSYVLSASGTAAMLTAGSANAIADGAVSTTAKLANSVVTYAKIQNVAVSSVLGNSSASVAQAPQALSMATLAGMLSGQTMNIVGSSSSCTGNAATATVATSARGVGIFDGTTYTAPNNSIAASGGRAVNLNPNTYAYGVSFEFKNASLFGFTGNYTGLITVAPWLGTTGSTGDPNYQLAFSPTAANSTSAPLLRIRAGIDTTWGSWATIIHDSNFATAIPNSGVGAGTYNNVTVNAKGIVTGGSNVGYLTGNQTISLSGDLSGSGTTSISATIAANAVTNAKIANSAVTYAKIQNVSAASVLGNPSASVSQAPQEITFANLNNLLSGAAKAWVTFNENPTTGAITINASFNVSSITRINYGQYRVNFSTAFGDANYAISGTIGFESNGGYLYGGFLNVARSATPKTTTYCEVTASYGDGNTYNARYVHVVIDR